MKIGILSRAVLLLAAIATLAVASPAPAQDAPTPFNFPITGGKVQDSIDRGIFTYIEVVTAGGRFWVVVPICGVKAGDSVDVAEGRFYNSIYNEELGITFENLVVPTKININGQAFKAFAAHELPRGCIIRPPAKK